MTPTQIMRIRETRKKVTPIAAAICLTVGLAGGLTAVTAPMMATQVEAGFWGKVKKGVKKAGAKAIDGANVVKDGVKAARKAKAGLRKGIRDVGAGVAARTTRETIKRSHEVIMQSTGQWDRNAKESVDTTAGAIGNLIRRDGPGLADNLVDRKAKGTARGVGGTMYDCLFVNGVGCNFRPPKLWPYPENGPGGWGRSGGPAPGKRQGAGINLKRNPPGARDRSVWGRPAGVAKKDLRLRRKTPAMVRDHRLKRRPARMFRDQRAKRRLPGMSRDHLVGSKRMRMFRDQRARSMTRQVRCQRSRDFDRNRLRDHRARMNRGHNRSWRGAGGSSRRRNR